MSSWNSIGSSHSFSLETVDDKSKTGLQGGYDYDWVDPDATSYLTCLICQLVAKEAHQTSCCGKIFCKMCIETWRKQPKAACPNCRVESFKVFEDKSSIRRVNDLAVRCTNRKRGCKWEGELRDIIGHTSQNCPKQLIRCSRKCGVELERRLLANHMNYTCGYRTVKCAFCTFEGQYKIVKGKHLNIDCQEVPVDCLNKEQGCQEKIKRANQIKHLEVCPKEQVKCKYVEICNKTMKREDEDNHYSTCTDEHLSNAWMRLQRVEEEMAKVVTVKLKKMEQALKAEFIRSEKANDAVEILDEKLRNFQAIVAFLVVVLFIVLGIVIKIGYDKLVIDGIIIN